MYTFIFCISSYLSWPHLTDKKQCCYPFPDCFRLHSFYTRNCIPSSITLVTLYIKKITHMLSNVFHFNHCRAVFPIILSAPFRYLLRVEYPRIVCVILLLCGFASSHLSDMRLVGAHSYNMRWFIENFTCSDWTALYYQNEYDER